MKHIVFVNGYRITESIKGAVTSKPYLFRKGFVTEVEDIDADAILNKTSSDVQWCMKTPRTERPFKTLEDFCKGKGYEVKDYLKTHFLISL